MEKNWIKIFAFLSIFILLHMSNINSQPQKVEVLVPLGPSIIPFSIFMPRTTINNIELNFTIWRTLDELVIKAGDDKFDLIIAPFVTLTNLYNKGINVKHLATFNWASFYLVSHKNKKDLIEGEKIYIAQKGSTQDIIFSVYLQERGLKDKVNIYYSTPQEITSLFIAKKIDYALLPEPFVSMCLANGGNIILDIQKIYRELFKGTYLPITSIGVRKNLDKDLILKIDQIFREAFKNLSQNPNIYVEKSADILKIDKNIIKVSLRRLSFRYQRNSANKNLLAFLEFILEKSPQIINNNFPNEEFFKL